MATRKETIEFILDQLAPLPVRARAMFGGHALYCDEKVVALIGDDTLFVKPTAATRELFGDAEMAPPYPRRQASPRRRMKSCTTPPSAQERHHPHGGKDFRRFRRRKGASSRQGSARKGQIAPPRGGHRTRLCQGSRLWAMSAWRLRLPGARDARCAPIRRKSSGSELKTKAIASPSTPRLHP